MRNLGLVALGGAIGSVLRGGQWLAALGYAGGSVVVGVSACLIGYVAGMIEIVDREERIRAFLPAAARAS